MTNNREIQTSYGTVRNINNETLRKRKLYKTVALAISSVSLAAVIALTSAGCGKKEISPVPEGQIMTTITMQIEKDETISEFADRFYTDDCEGVYNSISNYETAIKEQNNIHKASSYIKAGDTIEIPVIIDENNPYYLQVLEIKNQISEVENNNLWVRYTVEYGDRLSTLAELASANISETYEITSQIASKNGMNTKSMLRAGQEIWIMNPELGDLKTQLNEAEEQLKQSLIGEQIKK